MGKRVLIVAAHPDDEVLGCGGTICKLVEAGNQVSILYLSSGDNIESIREEEAKEACKFLNINSYFFLRLKGSEFVVKQENINQIISVFSEIKPQIIYVNHDEDADFEHLTANKLVSESLWRYNALASKDNRIMALVLYEVHKPMSSYNLIEDVSIEMDKKMNAMTIYSSQLKTTRWDLAIKGLNQYRGLLHDNLKYAEVFQIKKLSSILPLLDSM